MQNNITSYSPIVNKYINSKASNTYNTLNVNQTKDAEDVAEKEVTFGNGINKKKAMIALGAVALSAATLAAICFVKSKRVPKEIIKANALQIEAEIQKAEIESKLAYIKDLFASGGKMKDTEIPAKIESCPFGSKVMHEYAADGKTITRSSFFQDGNFEKFTEYLDDGKVNQLRNYNNGFMCYNKHMDNIEGRAYTADSEMWIENFEIGHITKKIKHCDDGKYTADSEMYFSSGAPDSYSENIEFTGESTSRLLKMLYEDGKWICR